jgi:hypothetical protein
MARYRINAVHERLESIGGSFRGGDCTYYFIGFIDEVYFTLKQAIKAKKRLIQQDKEKR